MILFNENLIELKTEKEDLFFHFIDYIIFIILASLIIQTISFKAFSIFNPLHFVISVILFSQGIVLKKIIQKFDNYKDYIFNFYIISCITSCLILIDFGEKDFIILPILFLFFILTLSAFVIDPKFFFNLGYSSILAYLAVISWKLLFSNSEIFYSLREKLLLILVPFILLTSLVLFTGNLIKFFLNKNEFLEIENKRLKKQLLKKESFEYESKSVNSLDFLTNILNKEAGISLLSNFIQMALKYNFTLSIALVDISKLNQINILQGTNIGDLTLLNFVENFKSIKRESDIICRYTGGSFLLIFPKTNEKESETFIQKLKDNNSIEFNYALTNLKEVKEEKNNITETLLKITCLKLFKKKSNLKI